MIQCIPVFSSTVQYVLYTMGTDFYGNMSHITHTAEIKSLKNMHIIANVLRQESIVDIKMNTSKQNSNEVLLHYYIINIFSPGRDYYPQKWVESISGHS